MTSRAFDTYAMYIERQLGCNGAAKPVGVSGSTDYTSEVSHMDYKTDIRHVTPLLLRL